MKLAGISTKGEIDFCLIVHLFLILIYCSEKLNIYNFLSPFQQTNKLNESLPLTILGIILYDVALV